MSSTCQLYSGTGTALFDWIRHASPALEFEILIDTADPRNFGIARDFCRDRGIRLHPSPPLPVPGCPDSGVADVGVMLQTRRWDYVECVSWANAATNLAVLEHRPPRTALLFTPHTQPLDTLQGYEALHSVHPVFLRMIAESDAVFLDSRRELAACTDAVDPGDRGHVVPLGVDTGRFAPAPGELRNRILCLGDFAEARKRVDLVFAAFSRCLADDPSIRLEIAGARSRELVAPRDVASAVVRHGYVDPDELVRLYRESRVLLQLSDYEAFGLPIAEALCCGTPVVIPDQETLRDVFDHLPGVSFVDRNRADHVAAAVAAAPEDPGERREIAARARERFSFDATYGRKLRIVRSLREPVGTP